MYKKILAGSCFALFLFGVYKANESKRKRIAWLDDRINTFEKIEKYLERIEEDESIDQEEFSRIFDEQMEFMDIIHNLDVV